VGQMISAAGDSGPARPPRWLDTVRAELGDRAATALAEEHFEPELAIRERAHQAEARARGAGRPRSYLRRL